MSFPFFSRKEKKMPARMPIQKPLEMPEELYPELPELPELKEPEPLPLRQASTERVRAAVEKKEQELPRPLLPEQETEHEMIIPEYPEEKPLATERTKQPFTDDSEQWEKPESAPKPEWLTEPEVKTAAAERKERRAFSPAKPAYMEGADFRKNVTNLNSAMRKPSKLKRLEAEEEKRFEELHSNIEDLQRKIVMTDKTIFGG